MKRSKGPTVAGWTLLFIVVALLFAAKVYRRQNIEESEKESPSENPLDSRRRPGAHLLKPEGRLGAEAVERQDMAEAVEADAEGVEAEARAVALPVFHPNRHHAELSDDEEEDLAEVAFANRHPEHSTLDFLSTPRDSICSDDDAALMMVIFSRPEGRGSRSAIRKTWAKFDSTRYASVKMK